MSVDLTPLSITCLPSFQNGLQSRLEAWAHDPIEMPCEEFAPIDTCPNLDTAAIDPNHRLMPSSTSRSTGYACSKRELLQSPCRLTAVDAHQYTCAAIVE